MNTQSPPLQGSRPLQSALPADDLWVLYRGHRANEGGSEPARRLDAGARAAGLRCRFLDPRSITLHPLARPGRVPRMLLHGFPIAPPKAVLGRSGTRFTATDRLLIHQLGASGARTLPTAAALETAGDKAAQLRVLGDAGLPVPLTAVLPAGPDAAELAAGIGYPLVLKRVIGSGGGAVRLCPGPEALGPSLAMLGGRGPVLAQRYIASSHGRDMRIVVIGGRIHAAMIRRSADGGLASNIAAGGIAEAVIPPPAAAMLALGAAAVLGLEIAGVDLLFDGDSFAVCEVNTAPGFVALDAACGCDTAAAIIALATTDAQAQARGCAA